MKIMRVGVDLAKNVFHVYGVDRNVDRNEKPVWRRRLTRGKWLKTVLEKVEPGCEIGMEACAGAHLPVDFIPKKSALQLNVGSLKAGTWERVNRSLLGDAKQEGVEKGQAIRVDSTVTETPIHEPSDSTLLWDSLRVLVRLLRRAQALPGAPELDWHNHSRVGKRRAQRIHYARQGEEGPLVQRPCEGGGRYAGVCPGRLIEDDGCPAAQC